MKIIHLFPLSLCLLFSTLMWGQKKEYVLEKLHYSINTPAYDEISPVVSLDGKTIYFTRVAYPEYVRTLVEKGEDLSTTWPQDRFDAYLCSIFTRIARHTITNPSRSSFNQDIWIAQSFNGEFDQIIHPGYPLNNAMPNSVSALTPSGNELIIINQFEKEGGMKKGFSIVRNMGNDQWSFPEPVGIENYYNSGSDVSITTSSDGQVLILSMERHDSRGKNDLYVCFRNDEGNWSAPENMGRFVNTSAGETTPFLSEDGKNLFFSRSGGNNDIYMATRKGDSYKKWTKPRRLIAPINSKGDDSQPYFNSATGFLYFTSNRDGSSDIFRVKIAPAIPRFVTVKGKIINTKTGQPVDAKILMGNATNKNLRNVYVSDDGSFRLSVPKGVAFHLLVEKPGYMAEEKVLNYRKDYVYFKEKEVNLEITPLEEGTHLALSPIYFQRSKAEVLSKSYPAMDEIADFLTENYNINIRIEGHTDNQGDEEALIKLSKERADAVKHYLVYTKRINPLRIETAGYGASEGVTDNSTEEKREENRRVEVEIIKVYDTPSNSQAIKNDQ